MGTDDIAKALHVSRDTLYKWAARGYPDWPREAGKLPNGEWRIRRIDFDRWLRWRMQQRKAA